MSPRASFQFPFRAEENALPASRPRGGVFKAVGTFDEMFAFDVIQTAVRPLTILLFGRESGRGW